MYSRRSQRVEVVLIMRPRTRFWWGVVAIVISAAYGVLVSKDSEFARTIMLGYVGVLLTILVLCQVWKKHD